MISAETISALPLSKWHDAEKTPFRIGDWLCAGAWAVRGGDEILALAKAEKDNERNRDILQGHESKLPGVAVTEDITLRMPFVAGVEDVVRKCRACDGSGLHDCNCDQCDAGCDTCEGDGEEIVAKGRAEDVGQRVYRSDDLTTIIDARLGALLDGLTIVRLGTTATDPLGGIDDAGRLVVLVMPLRADVRTPTVSP